MSAVTFDTLQFVQTLTESGFEQKQAEGMAKAFRNAHEETEAVTKGDLKEVELKMENRFEQVRGELNLLKWMLGALLALAITNFAKQFLQ